MYKAFHLASQFLSIANSFQFDDYIDTFELECNLYEFNEAEAIEFVNSFTFNLCKVYKLGIFLNQWNLNFLRSFAFR